MISRCLFQLPLSAKQMYLLHKFFIWNEKGKELLEAKIFLIFSYIVIEVFENVNQHKL